MLAEKEGRCKQHKTKCWQKMRGKCWQKRKDGKKEERKEWGNASRKRGQNGEMLADTEGPVCLPSCFLATMLPFFLALWPFVLMLISPAFSRSTFPTACSPSLLFSVVPDINAHGGERNQNGKNAKEATETRPSLRRREESKRTKRERWIFFVQVVRRSDKKYVRLKMT